MSTFAPPFPQCDVVFDDPVAEQTVNQLPTNSEQRLLYLQRNSHLLRMLYSYTAKLLIYLNGTNFLPQGGHILAEMKFPDFSPLQFFRFLNFVLHQK